MAAAQPTMSNRLSYGVGVPFLTALALSPVLLVRVAIQRHMERSNDFVGEIWSNTEISDVWFGFSSGVIVPSLPVAASVALTYLPHPVNTG
eukprot:COSAG05_NODE_16621_length_342_cov_0.629630_1_plen_90_part_10